MILVQTLTFACSHSAAKGGERYGPVVTVETVNRLRASEGGLMPALEELFNQVTVPPMKTLSEDILTTAQANTPYKGFRHD